MKFTFNKKAQRMALQALRHLETGSFASAVLGAFSASPRTTAVVALGLFVICRACATIIAGLEEAPANDAPVSPVPSSKQASRDDPDDVD